jgi:serine/threonine-protein kinase
MAYYSDVMQFEDADAARETTPQPGRFGRFYLQELINSGGLAEIWVATDSQGQPFALRKMRNASFFNFSERRQFAHGCEVLSKIHHNPNVINYVEHGKIEGAPYLLMEYVESSNLKQLLARNDPLLGENVAQIIIDMTLGLEQVHDSGFIHLDIKPENVLVTRSGGVRLIDFDLAQTRPEKPEKMPRYPGTPAYMAPEQLRHQPIDQRADIFALGVSMYEVLTGQKPFPGDTPDEILRRQLSGPPAPPREHNPEVPLPLERAILKCLKADMDGRYLDMEMARREIQAALYV